MGSRAKYAKHYVIINLGTIRDLVLGTTMAFSIVTGRVCYRLMTPDGKASVDESLLELAQLDGVAEGTGAGRSIVPEQRVRADDE